MKKYDRIISEEQLDRAATKAVADRAQCLATKAAIEVAQANLAIVNTAAVSPGRDDSLQKAQGCCQSEVRDSARGRLKFYPE